MTKILSNDTNRNCVVCGDPVPVGTGYCAECQPKEPARKAPAQKIVWEALGHGDYNPNFSGYTVGYQCTGLPRSGFVLYSRGAGACWNQRTKPEFPPAPGMKPLFFSGEWVWARNIAQLALDCAYACSEHNGPEANAVWILQVLERAGVEF